MSISSAAGLTAMSLSMTALFSSAIPNLHSSPVMEISPSKTLQIQILSTKQRHFNITITVDDGRVFVGDSKSSFLSGDGNITIKDTSNSNSLYQTARIFTRTSSYKFEINSSETHVVRLHFFPFSSHGYNLPFAVFDVSVSGFSLFRDFKGDMNKNGTFKEFFIKINSSKLVISFSPSEKIPVSFAFVNAIEVFSAQLVSPTGSLIQVLETVHRINVGGPKISDSTLLTSWISDDKFLTLPVAAKPATNSSPIRYEKGVIPDITPLSVYRTARQMNRDETSSSQTFNITWSFGVSSGSKYLVRLHFCDIVSENLNELYFHVYVGDSIAIRDFHLGDHVSQLAAPYYAEFIANPDKSSHINISVGPSNRMPFPKQNVILNGVEIMMINDGRSGLVSRTDSKKPSIGFLVGLPLGGFVFILLLVLVFVLVFKRGRKTTTKKKQKARPKESVRWLPISLHGGSSHTTATERTSALLGPNINLGLKISFADIQLATNNFHENSLIGSGGFGNVYRGILKDGAKVAVKRGKPGSGQGFPEFVAEIMVLSKIRHRHLVSLIGYCEEQSEMILVYEFLENGPLKNHLYGSDFPCLSWKQRLQICIDSARGLHYLHTGSAHGIIHRDVKSANILLDENYSAKVADFGLSKAVPSLDQSHITTIIKGSFGYLDPEYYKRHHLTDKSDVYSFGVVLLEILSARPAVDHSVSGDQVNLAEWAVGMQKKGLLEQIIDPRLMGQIDPNSLKKFAETAEKCLAEYGVDRPTMGDVLWRLQYALQLQEMAMHRETHDDSAMNAVGLPLPNVRRVPSSCVEVERDNPSVRSYESSEATASGVFSQLFGSDGR
ncbi:probable receptor-like protein kinase At5g24010 [Magnolia sinica]|uniref:probable receptor-like protein kinase At5g24010 n=1 Tax=Magnolia sinica TaxID=86752 RepID=UPI002659B8AE|nr:probable receptor-like protein kinase At5g24010 [Magnolia sinica]